MAIDPIWWVGQAEIRSPRPCFMTHWYDGTTHPARPGYYERHFTDSLTISGTASIQYWDGEFWSAEQGWKPHWRQVGDYPAWRGLTEAQHNLQNGHT